MSKTHDVKIWPEYFEAVQCGRKTFEVRLNDRHYRDGDTICLREWEPSGKSYTGRRLNRSIGYVLPLEDGRVVFSISTDADKATNAGLESSAFHLSALVDDLRNLLTHAMQSMRTVESAAHPTDESIGDLDAKIPYEAWRNFVDSRAELLHAIQDSPHHGSVQPPLRAAA